MKDSIFAIRRTLQNYTNGGYVLIMVTVLAMIIANSPLASMYFSWWNVPVSLQIGNFNLFSHHGEPMTLMQFINDALMAIFFFSVGLEIKREVLVGELSSVKQALLPVIAAGRGYCAANFDFPNGCRRRRYIKRKCDSDGYRYRIFFRHFKYVG